MNKINCLITTKEHRDIAQKLGLNPTVVTNLAALHLTLNPTALTFTEADAKAMLSLRKEALMEAYLAVPNYTIMEGESTRLAGTDTKTGEIRLWKLPSENPMGFFADYIKGGKENSEASKLKKAIFDMLIKQGQIDSIDSLITLIDNSTDAYRFLLWHEMSHRLNNDAACYWANGKDLMTSDKLNIEYRATLDALNKIKEWRKQNPVKKSEDKAQSPMQATTSVVESFAEFNKEHITFEGSTHTYSVDGKPVDTSVTLWVHRDNPIEEEKDPTVAGFLEVASEVGTIHDELSRVFFDKSAEKRASYPNMSSEDLEGFNKQLELLKAELDKTFPNGYKVYTNEDYLRVAGVIQTKEGPKTIAGTMDMLIVDNEGNLHIYDFKTHRANNGVQFHKDTLEGYYNQVALYLALLEANYPELKGKIKTHKLVQYNVQYETPRGSRKNETGTTDYIIKNGLVYIKQDNGLPISILNHTQEVEGEVRRTYSSGRFMGLVPVLDRQSEPVMGIRISSSRQDLATPILTETPTPQVGVDNTRVKVDTTNPIIKINQAFTPSQRRDRVNFIARMFSDEVTGAYEEELAKAEEALELAVQDNDLIAYTKASTVILELSDPVKGRHLAIKKRTVETIVKNIRDAFLEMRDYAEDTYTKQLYLNVLDNFEYLLDQATFVIELNEHLNLSLVSHSQYEGTKESKVLGGEVEELAKEAQEGREEDDDDEDGSRATGNDGWSFKVRYVDPHSSLSKTTKRILSNLVSLNQVTGDPELDDLGNEKYINEQHAHTVLLDSLSFMIDDSDFCIKETDEDGNISYTFPALEKLVNKYKWVQQVIDELTNNPSEVSAFYADFRKDFIPYWMSKEVTENVDGVDVTTVRSIPLNLSTGYESAKNTLLYNNEQGISIDEDSVYDAKGLRAESIAKGKELLSTIDMQEVEEEDMDEVSTTIAKAVRMVGLPMTAMNVLALWQTADGDKDITDVVHALNRIFDKAEQALGKKNAHLIAEAEQDFNILCRLLNEITETDAVGSFRDGDKTRYSYSAPNYINTQFKMLRSEDRRQQYLNEEFKPYNWFYNSTTGKWRNRWLELIESDEDVKANMALKELSNIDNEEYSNWSPGLIRERFITEYFAAGYNPASKKQYAYYNYPIFSDSPVAMFIKFLRYTEDYEGEVTRGLREVALQELERIKLVQDRENAGVSGIACFDGNRGKSFCFLPFLNNYKTAEGVSFIDRVSELSKTGIDSVNEFIDGVIFDYMEEQSAKFLEDHALMIDKLVQTKIADNTEDAMDKLREFFWNHHYAESLIIQLTTTDLAFYKDGTDFQKRYKEVYAAGTKLNTQSKYGRTHEKTIYLSDQEITSINYTDIKKALQVAVDKGHISKMDMDDILHKFRNITATDAQAYRSISSFRAILDMMGLWSDNMQKAFDRLLNGEWDMADFNIVWQTIKPFVYTLIGKSDGLGGQIKVPHQNKNSEFLLLSMHLLVATSMGKSPKLVALNKFMEDNDIDVAQFESAVKAGKQGCIDISYSEAKLQKWITANDKLWGEILDASTIDEGTDFEFFKDGNDNLLDSGKISQEEYNKRMKALEPSSQEVEQMLNAFTKDENGEFKPDVVHEIPYRDYVVAQPTPEHLFDAEAVFGSQFRNLIVSDMPDDPSFRVKINGKEYTKQEVLDLYNSIITENLLDDFEKVQGRFASVEVLQKELMKLVRGNAKYGKNLLDALLLVAYTDPNTGQTKRVFNIPLYSPSITAQILELTTSMFKNAVTKLKIKGAACILASNFGFTNELHINYNEDGSIKEAECYLPWYSKKYFEPFLVTKTEVVNGKTVEYQELDITKVPKDLLLAVGYRIPTEDKYSMIPLRIKGFLPQLNGGTIMLPAEITQIAGSDFDVDKLFMMLPAFKVDTHDMQRARKDFEAINNDSAVNKLLAAIFANNDEADVLEQSPDNFRSWFEQHKQDYEYDTPRIRKVKYNPTREASEQSRDARNNMLIDISRGILLNLDTAEKLLNPGSFDRAKLAARIAQVTSSAELIGAYSRARNLDPTNVKAIRESLKKESLKSIDKFLKAFKSERDPLALETFVYNHVQNMTGGMLIGMYANNTTMLAKFQGSGIKLKVIPPTSKFKGLDNTFSIDGHKIEALDAIFSPWGERISKNCAEFSAASVDNVKDPVLADLLQNTNTAGVAGFMLRAGIPVRVIGLMFTQPMVKEAIQKYGTLGYSPAIKKNTLLAIIESYGESTKITEADKSISSDLLLDNIIEAATTNLDSLDELKKKEIIGTWAKAARLMSHIQGCASDMSAITRVSRADSPNGAIGITMGKARNQVLAVTNLIATSKTNKYRISGLSKAMMANHKVALGSTKDLKRQALMNARMTRLQAFYSLGIELPLLVMSPFFAQLNERLDDQLSRIYIQAPYGSLKDEMVETFYKEYIEYMLTESPLFGNDNTQTFDLKRDYYLYEFPAKFYAAKNNPKFKEFTVLSKIGVREGVIQLFRSGRLTPAIRENFTTDFDSMIASEDPKIQKMAIDLFMYSFYKDGYLFGPNAFGLFFSPFFLTSFTEFMDTLRGIEDKVKTMDFTRFVSQFYNNHWQQLTYEPKESLVMPIVRENITDPDSDIIVPKKLVINELTAESRLPYQYILYEGGFYKLKYGSDTACTYAKVQTVTDELGKKYNASEDVADMATHQTSADLISKNKQIGAKRISMEELMARMEEMFALMDAMEAAMADMDAQFEAMENQGYNLEDSLAQLDQPLC